jgi:hypothetical protein
MSDAHAKAYKHAKSTMQQARLKGLNIEILSGALITEAIMATFKIDMKTALPISVKCVRLAESELNKSIPAEGNPSDA